MKHRVMKTGIDRLKQFAIVALILFTAACADEKVVKRSYPVINTDDVTGITELGATFNGEVLDIGDGIVEYGFVFNHGFLGSYPFPAVATKISLGTTDTRGKFSIFANAGMAAGETYNLRTYAISTKGTVVLGQEVKFVSQGSLGPEVSDISPKEATVGDMIVITGKRFSTAAGNNIVSIGEGAFTPVLKAKADSLWVRMPAGASVGDNPVILKVGQQSVTAAQKVKLLQITVASFTPESVALGDTIIVNGTNFPVFESPASLKILGLTLATHKATRTQLRAVLNQDPTSANTPVELLVGTQSVKAANPIKLFPPKIDAITPAKGNNGTEVTITGDYFHTTPSKNTVAMAGKSMTVTGASRTSLKFRVPADITPGSYAVSVKTFNQTTVAATAFEIVLPVIASISPLSGTWGTEVTLHGQNFGPTIGDNVVTFIGSTGTQVGATVVSASETQVKVKVPDLLTTKTWTIRITVAGSGNRTTTFNSFSLDAPVVSSFTPTEGKLFSVVTISGNNFNPTIANNEVKFGNFVAEITSASTTQLSVNVPSMADVLATISVTSFNQTGTSLSAFHVVSPWRKIKDFPGTARSNATAFALNGEGYVGLGSVGGTQKTFYKYNPTTDTWSTVTAYTTDSQSAFTDGTAFEVGGFGFVGKGQPESAVFRKYDPTANAWSPITSFPVTNVYNSVSFVIAGKGYVATGTAVADTGVIPCCFGTGSMWQYDPVANTWSSKAGMPVQGRTDAAGFAIDSKGYIVGGRPHTGSSTVYSDTWEYDSGTNQWAMKASLPAGQWGYPIGFAVNGKGYVLGSGVNFETQVGSFAVFDPATNQWTSLPGHPTDFNSVPVTFVIGSKAYVGLGISVNGSMKRDFWEFDGSKL